MKFSIRSYVDLEDPRLRRFLRYLGDQMSIANDIASYEKEKRGFQTGKVTSMINLVHVLMEVNRVDTTAAKSMAYAWQLYTEDIVLKELEMLKKGDELSLDEWEFVDTCLVAASGSLLTSVVISRYGGEDTRIV